MNTSLSDKQISKNFFDKYMGAKGPVGWVSRYISNTGRWYTDMLISEGQIKPDDVVLDVGCGSASMVVNLVKKVGLNNSVCAVEPSDEQLKLAQNTIGKEGLAAKVDLKKCFASPLPYKDDYFDVVYSSFIIKHFADKTLEEFFREAYRVLKPGGRFLGWEFAKVGGFFKRVAKDPKKAMNRFRNFNDLKPFLEKAGFSGIKEFEVKNRGFWDTVEDVGFKAIRADGRQ